VCGLATVAITSINRLCHQDHHFINQSKPPRKPTIDPLSTPHFPISSANPPSRRLGYAPSIKFSSLINQHWNECTPVVVHVYIDIHIYIYIYYPPSNPRSRQSNIPAPTHPPLSDVPPRRYVGDRIKCRCRQVSLLVHLAYNISPPLFTAFLVSPSGTNKHINTTHYLIRIHMYIIRHHHLGWPWLRDADQVPAQITVEVEGVACVDV
jgi:hypothetical protein